jgi:hypothetical protein
MFCLPCSSAALQHNASSERVQAIFVAVQQSEGFAPQKPAYRRFWRDQKRSPPRVAKQSQTRGESLLTSDEAENRFIFKHKAS